MVELDISIFDRKWYDSCYQFNNEHMNHKTDCIEFEVYKLVRIWKFHLVDFNSTKRIVSNRRDGPFRNIVNRHFCHCIGHFKPARFVQFFSCFSVNFIEFPILQVKLLSRWTVFKSAITRSNYLLQIPSAPQRSTQITEKSWNICSK